MTRLVHLSSILCLNLLVLVWPVRALEKVNSLSVEVDSEGVAIAHAILVLPAPPSHVHSILTDYARWPELFPRQPKINTITREPDRTIVDMAVPAFFFPIDLELVTATRELPSYRIETQMIKGDFSHYQWTWQLSPLRKENHTQASLTFQFAPNIWVPNWMLRWTVRSELEAHLEMLHQAANERPLPEKANTLVETIP